MVAQIEIVGYMCCNLIALANGQDSQNQTFPMHEQWSPQQIHKTAQ